MKNQNINPIFQLNPATYENACLAYAQPDLSASETCRLITEARAGDGEAKKKILSAYLKQVYNVVGANYYLKPFVQDIDDFIQEGILGLNRAIESFDPEKASFPTYSNYWIRQRVSLYMKERTGTIHHYEKQGRKVKILEKTIYDYEREHGQKPTLATLTKLTGLGAVSVQRTIRGQMCKNVISLNQDWEYGSEENCPYNYPNCPDTYVESHEDYVVNRLEAQQLVKELYHVAKKEIDIKILDFYLSAEADTPHQECAKALSVSRQYISKRIKGLRKLLLTLL